MKLARVSVPASSGNLGSGFDVLAAALDLRNELEVRIVGKGEASVEIEGEGAESLPRGQLNLVLRILRRHLGHKQLAVKMRNRIPLGAGLGSSGAARLAAHAAGLALSGSRDPLKALRLAALEEGHPDNVAASFFGGVTAVLDPTSLDVYRLKVPSALKAVVCVPGFSLSTETAREALPDEVPLRDAVFNLSRVVAWLAALSEKRYDRLEAATQDALHQPYRQSLVPGLRETIGAALEAGALGACLSGAGPSVLAIVKSGGKGAASAMQAAFKRRGVGALARTLAFDNRGLVLTCR